MAQIQERFVQGELRPGDRLPSERELAEQFGVSRTAVREAVKALQEKRLVEVRPGKGTYVVDVADSRTDLVRETIGLMVGPLTGDGRTDLIQVRAILEPEIAALAAEKALEDELMTMQRAIDDMDANLDNVERFVDADLEFHLALAKATQNSLIPILIEPVVDLLREQRKRMSLIRGAKLRGQQHHRRILKAVRERDPEAARQAMTDHLEQVVRDSNAAAELLD